MNVKKDIDVAAFMKGIKACRGNVFFISPEDKIDLKSVLSQYVFLAIMNNRKLIKNGEIICEEQADYKNLEQFLE